MYHNRDIEDKFIDMLERVWPESDGLTAVGSTLTSIRGEVTLHQKQHRQMWHPTLKAVSVVCVTLLLKHQKTQKTRKVIKQMAVKIC